VLMFEIDPKISTKGIEVNRFLKIIVVIVGILILIGSFGFIFMPLQMDASFAIVASRPEGLGTLRGDLGGALMMVAIFTLYGARSGQSAWLLVPVTFMLTVLFGRSVHMLVDGVSQPAIRSTVVEIVLVLLLEFSRRRLARDTAPETKDR
jgi:hypothetical protein